jgi:hypothetical protein
MAGKYLVVVSGMSAIPRSLRKHVQDEILKEYSAFDLDFDFTGRKRARDLAVRFSDEVPIWGAYGESSRPWIGGEQESGESTIYVGMMRAMRLETSPEECEIAFPESVASLGSLIANTAIHEIGHMVGLDTGGYDSAGHTSDVKNYMWDASGFLVGGAKLNTYVSRVFEYTVKRGDTLSGIVLRYRLGTLDKCRIGPTKLTWTMAWDHPGNKQAGFVGDTKKSGKPGRIANSPHWIYPGEKVALVNQNYRTQKYRLYMPGFVGAKKFTDDQIKTMKQFIADRLAAGKG